LIWLAAADDLMTMIDAADLAPEIPEDLYQLIKKAVAVRKHLERNRKDKVRILILP
jgi:small subunit ribosomal protein S13e